MAENSPAYGAEAWYRVYGYAADGSVESRTDFYPKTRRKVAEMFDYARSWNTWEVTRYMDHVIIAQSKPKEDQ